ncbi:aminopeptidase Q [Perognathus longimembris pacificus]|uniref:aminopeptidase Q n=1 Tax=Perognathus longimembris pacificus TaxID=214514 RepID=UPI0020189C3F|nr:aminopeptidase Q [Perognathus longimembris pacificus]
MPPPARSGFYVSRGAALGLAALAAALLLALAVLGALHARGQRAPPSEEPSPAPGAQDAEVLVPAPPEEPPAPVSDAPARPPGPWQRLRLPPWLTPEHYDVELWPRLRPGAPAPDFTGRVRLAVRCRAATTRLLLHSLLPELRAEVRGPLDAGPLQAAAPEAGRVPVLDVWFARDTEFAVLELGEPLQPGRRYELRLSFAGRAARDAREGLFLTEYRDQGRRRALIASHLEPTYARNVFPCLDEPALKATFNITIIHHPSYVALSNMPPLGQSEKVDEDGSRWRVTTFRTTPRMPTYLVALAVCDFDRVSRMERGKEISIWARKDAIASGNADFALNITGPIFSFLEDLFNISYPLPKTDFIALPVFDERAMENWGLLMFDESLLLLQPSDELMEKKTLISYIVSHEVGHQWFGNLVTMKWWNNIWLNEGFASYFEFGVTSHFNPTLPRNEIFFSNLLHGVLKEDHALEARAVSVKGENFTGTSEIIGLFDLFTYYKGASVLRMLSCFLNEHLFISALKSYLEAFSYSNAEQDDLWSHFQMAIDSQTGIILPATVKAIMDTWTQQSGFPVVTLHVSTGAVTQEPFYLGKAENRTLLAHNGTWIVPIHWMKSGIAQSLVWLEKDSKVFPEMQLSYSDHEWVILNLNLTGYYRVNYDQLGWMKLKQQLERDPKAIPVIHRLQLMGDAFFLSKHNYMEVETALDLTKYLAEEDEIIVWNEVLVNLETRELVSDTNNYDLYLLLKKYLLQRLRSVWNTYSAIIREDVAALQDNFLALLSLEKLFRTACWLGLQDCLQLSREFFQKWMSHGENEIPHVIKDSILCYGIARGGDEEWGFLFGVYTNTTSEDDKIALAYALSCSRDPWALSRLMEHAMTASPSTLNDTNVMEIVAGSEVGWFVAKDFLINNRQAVVERYGTHSLVTLLYILGRPLSTDLQIAELQQAFSNMLDEDQRMAVHAKLQMMKNENVKNKERGARIAEWLRRNT